MEGRGWKSCPQAELIISHFLLKCKSFLSKSMLNLKVTAYTWGARNATVLVDKNSNYWIRLSVFPQSTGYIRLGDVAPHKDLSVKHYSPVPGSYHNEKHVIVADSDIRIEPLDDSIGVYAVAGIT